MSLSIHQLLRYNSWANERLIELLRQSGWTNERTLLILSHMAAATSTWAGRLDESGTAHALWTAIPLPEAIQLLQKRQEDFERIALSLPSDRVFNYKTSTGIEFTNTVSEIVHHLVNHNSYHRGQIAEEMISAGLEPPSVDLIVFLRT